MLKIKWNAFSARKLSIIGYEKKKYFVINAFGIGIFWSR